MKPWKAVAALAVLAMFAATSVCVYLNFKAGEPRGWLSLFLALVVWGIGLGAWAVHLKDHGEGEDR